MSKALHEVEGFIALPLQFPECPAFPQTPHHYLFIKQHDPKIPNEDTLRSVFVTHLPIITTALHLRHLFGNQLSAGRVERIDFVNPHTNSGRQPKSRKRKRQTVEDISAELDDDDLPPVWQQLIHSTSTTAIIVFVDRSSMESSLKAAKMALKRGDKIIWGMGIEHQLPKLGLQRYTEHNKLKYSARSELLTSVDSYMSKYARLEEMRSNAEARKRQAPDEDGFVTVTRGARGRVILREDAKVLGEKQKDKSNGLKDFYRFQMRQKRKGEQGEFLRKFEEDKRRIDEMKKRRGRLKVSDD